VTKFWSSRDGNTPYSTRQAEARTQSFLIANKNGSDCDSDDDQHSDTCQDLKAMLRKTTKLKVKMEAATERVQRCKELLQGQGVWRVARGAWGVVRGAWCVVRGA
jgi:hypothetical protein